MLAPFSALALITSKSFTAPSRLVPHASEVIRFGKFDFQASRLSPTDDIWVYSNASDAGHDEYLRIWGVEGRSAPKAAEEAEELSMGYLRWDLASLDPEKKLTRAKLVLTQIANPGFTVEEAKATPLEVRTLSANFEEKTWDFAKLGSHLPGADAKSVYGSGYPEKLDKDQTVRIEIDLLKGPGDFAAAIAKALRSTDKHIAVALTTLMDPSQIGRTGVYKIYSNDTKEELRRPVLELGFE
jgi:hypothetical protein